MRHDLRPAGLSAQPTLRGDRGAIVALYFARDILIPFAFALTLTFIDSGGGSSPQVPHQSPIENHPQPACDSPGDMSAVSFPTGGCARSNRDGRHAGPLLVRRGGLLRFHLQLVHHLLHVGNGRRDILRSHALRF
jgi:hypothetical protein